MDQNSKTSSHQAKVKEKNFFDVFCLLLPTAYVVRREGCFDTCLSVCLSTPGGYLGQVQMGGTPARSKWGVPLSGVPHIGYPHQTWSGGISPQVPPVRPGRGGTPAQGVVPHLRCFVFFYCSLIFSLSLPPDVNRPLRLPHSPRTDNDQTDSKWNENP